MRTFEETIVALEVSAGELRFHADRLEGNADGHTADIGRLYRESARGCAVLARYQRGRIRTEGMTKLDGSTAATTEDDDGNA